MVIDNKNCFKHKNEYTVLLTDVGLGGLSIAAEVVERAPLSTTYDSLRIIFFRFSFNSRVESEKDEVLIFDNMLANVTDYFRPNLIMLACNSLSVIYKETDYSESELVPVIGIVDINVNQIMEKLVRFPDANIVILASELSVKKGMHKSELLKRGVSPEKVVDVACPGLALNIEIGYKSGETMKLVDCYIQEAVERLDDIETPIVVSLSCTHYGYIADTIGEVFRKKGCKEVILLNSNTGMADCLFQKRKGNQSDSYANVTIEVISSESLIKPEVITSIGELIGKTSYSTAAALMNYKYFGEVFDDR